MVGKFHGEGPIIPLGAMVEDHLISAKDLSRLHHFGKKVLPRIFLGYASHAGRIWKGDILVADIEELEKTDASELHVRRLNAKDVLTHPTKKCFSYSWPQMEKSSDLEEIRFWEPPPQSGTT